MTLKITGMAATVPLFDVLTTHGHADLALQTLTQKKYPGPGHSLGFGTKTLPENTTATLKFRVGTKATVNDEPREQNEFHLPAGEREIVHSESHI